VADTVIVSPLTFPTKGGNKKTRAQNSRTKKAALNFDSPYLADPSSPIVVTFL
jgi:hypothetical protein